MGSRQRESYSRTIPSVLAVGIANPTLSFHSNSDCSTNDRGVGKIVAIKKEIEEIEKKRNEVEKSLTQKDREFLDKYWDEL